MNISSQDGKEEPFFITAEIEDSLSAAGFVFEPPARCFKQQSSAGLAARGAATSLEQLCDTRGSDC